jgi:hypothetical protein
MIEKNIKTTQTHTRNPENTLAAARASPPGVLFLYWIGGPGRTGTVRREGPRERRLNRDCQNKKQKGKEKRDFSKPQPKPLLTEKLPPPSSSRVRAPAECRRVTAQAALLPLAPGATLPVPPSE